MQGHKERANLNVFPVSGEEIIRS